MHKRPHERLVGATVLVIFAVIFIPIILTGPIETTNIKEINIPLRPDVNFESKLVPLVDQFSQVIDEEKAETKTVDLEADSEIGIIQTETLKLSLPGDIDIGLSAWIVQLGSFSTWEKADKLNTVLKKAGFRAFVEPLTTKVKTVYRVRVGPELHRADADKILANIKSKMKLEGIVLSYP